MLLTDAGKQVEEALKRAQETPEWLAYQASAGHLQKLAEYLGVPAQVLKFTGELEMVMPLDIAALKRGIPDHIPNSPTDVPEETHPEDEVHQFLNELAAKNGHVKIEKPSG